MRWLFGKDLRIMRRSPALIGTLVLYPIAIALLIGLAVSSPSGRPVVAVYDGVPKGEGTLLLGSRRLSIAKYERELYTAIQPLHASTPARALADVRAGRALAALIVPSDIEQQIQALITTGAGTPTIRIVYNSRNPVEEALVKNALQPRLDDVQQAVADEVIAAVTDDLHKLEAGGTITAAGKSFKLLGFEGTRRILDADVSSLPLGSSLRRSLAQVAAFSTIAVAGLAIAAPDINTIGAPLSVNQSQLSGRSTPSAAYAAAVAAAVLLMFVAVLIAAGMLALERSENAYRRLVPVLVRPSELLAQKLALAAVCAFAMTLVTAVVLAAFAPLELARLPLWVAAIALGAGSFAALGLAVGALARDVGVASLLAFLIALPVAFVALVPHSVVSSGVGDALDAVSFVFPFRAALEALTAAFSDGGPALPLPLLHLAVLAAAFFGVGRLALARE
jgi:ABC-2 type transport system permease protein